MISQTHKTTWPNTDNRLDHNVFLKENFDRRSAIDELGGDDSLKGFLEYMGMAPDGAITEKVQGLNDLMRRQHIDRQRGPVDDRIFEIVSLRGSTTARCAN